MVAPVNLSEPLVRGHCIEGFGVPVHGPGTYGYPIVQSQCPHPLATALEGGFIASAMSASPTNSIVTRVKTSMNDMIVACCATCLIPRFDGAILSPEWKEALWARFVTGAPRQRTPSELQYNDRKLRSRS